MWWRRVACPPAASLVRHRSVSAVSSKHHADHCPDEQVVLLLTCKTQAVRFSIFKNWACCELIFGISCFDLEYLLRKLLINKKAQLSLKKPARRESMPKIAPVRLAYNVVIVFIRLAVVASEICEIPRNSLKILTYRVQGHPRSSILVSMESPYVISY